MCGIAGFYGSGNKHDILRMTDALWHRGPDEGNILIDRDVALGHRRLSIIDLEHGKQPMRDADSGIILTYNGEIYNHLEIRAELEKKGVKFFSAHSDTETLLKAFIAWGPSCFIRFNGMFACAFYDPARRSIWLARDRFGEKPLFYSHTSPGFAFASEIGALRLWPGFDQSIDEANIQRFFAWNYLAGNRAIHKGCKSVPPGSWLRLDIASRQIEIENYWKFELDPDESLTDSKEEELAEELRRLLLLATRRRLMSDVPLGIFLSGGIDSSAVLSAACQIADPDLLNTYTIGFREKSFDESAKAQQIAQALGAPNYVEYLSEEDLRSSISGILSKMSEPFGDASLIPTSHLCAFARQHVKVALSGDGGDELFGGYDPLAAIHPASWYRKLVPEWLHIFGRAMIEKLPSSDRNMSPEFKIKRFLRGLSYAESMQLPVWMSGLEPAEIGKFFDHPLSAAELYKDAIQLFESHPEFSSLEQALLFFTKFYLSDDILVKSDRASMMVSLETRAVFLDNDIVDFCQKLPMRFKYRNGHRKYLLKKALEKWLPADILRQPKKGFGIPLNLWLRSLPELKIFIPGLKPWVLADCMRQHKRRKGDYRFFLWDAQAYSRLAT